MLNWKLFAGLFLGGFLAFSATAGEVQKKSQNITDGGKRLQSREITGRFQMNGKGRDSNWGIAREAEFSYTVSTKIVSKIISKENLPNGGIKVVEDRKFVEYLDTLEVNPSVKLDFSTLPVDEFCELTRAVGLLAAYMGQPDVTAVAEGMVVGTQAIQKNFDGKEIPIPANFKDYVKEYLCQKHVKRFFKNRPVRGKTYRFTYIQSRKGALMKVTFANVDGSEASEEEKEILEKVSAFVDYNVLPDPNKRIGGTWTVAARDLSELFDPYLGTVYGEVDFMRKANDENGNWNVVMQPATLDIRNENHSKIGTLELRAGNATVEPKKLHNVINMYAKGRVKTENVTRHHLLFTAKVSNWCDWEGRVVSKIIE